MKYDYEMYGAVCKVLEEISQEEFDRFEHLVMTVWDISECEELVRFCEVHHLTVAMLEMYAYIEGMSE